MNKADFKRHFATGMSLLELLLVLAILTTMLSMTIPLWQQPKVQAQRLQAWLQLQRLALAQNLYYSQQGAYAERLQDLPLVILDDGYKYSMTMTPSGWILVATVAANDTQQQDKYCWQLRLDQDGNQQSYNHIGALVEGCN